MPQFDCLTPYKGDFPIFAPKSILTANQFEAQRSKYATAMANKLFNAPANSKFKYGKDTWTLDDLREHAAEILMAPLNRVAYADFWQKAFSKALDNSNNNASYIDQLLVHQLDAMRLPYPDPINAIYEFEDDVKDHLRDYLRTGQISDELSANLNAYLSQFLPVAHIEIAIFDDQSALKRALMALRQSNSTKLKNLITYANSNLLPIFKLSPNYETNSSWRIFSDIIRPMSLKSSFGNWLGSTYFMLIDGSKLINASDMEIKTAAQNAAAQFNSVMAFTLVKTKDLASLPAVARNMQPEQTPNTSNGNGGNFTQMLNNYSFPQKLDNPYKMAQALRKVIDQFTSTKETELKFKSKRNSFTHANRRHPNDINMPGRRTIIKYHPNIMIHLDTSGSVSEDQYQNALLALLAIAKQYDIPVYFQSFSDYVSDISYLDLRKYTVAESYHILQMIPKASGGTEYEGVWSTINKTPDNFVHFMFTDFEYGVSSCMRFENMPKVRNDLFYVAFASIDHYDLDSFARDMFKAGDYSIYSHILA